MAEAFELEAHHAVRQGDRVVRRVAVAAACAVAAVCGPPALAEEPAQKLVAAARAQVGRTVIYDGSYRRLAYPGGDVPVELATSRDPAAYRAGDLVTWRLPSGLPHIGIVSDRFADANPLVIHNIGAGAAEEDILLRYPQTGHFRLVPGETAP